jgi:hypothetical protein
MAIVLIKLIEEWLKSEQLVDFSIVYPGNNDTIMVGYEGAIRYDHHQEGYATIVSIYNKHVYIDYDDIVIEASRPDFFEKLKNILLHHKKVHSDCEHLRSLND